jgi:hypothetical protein
MVALATRSPSRSKASAPQAKTATVVLGWLAAGQTHAQILEDFPELTEDDIRACLAYAADRERRVVVL